MKYILLLSFTFTFKLIYASESVKCDFEEVYQDGSTQFGHLLFNDGLLRYQYQDNDLFTIIFNKDYFVIRNDNRSIVNRLEDNEILNELKLIITNYPNIDSSYSKDDIDIKIINSKESNFLKRISINSDEVNLSIYFINCNFEDISKKFFQPFSLANIKK